MEIAAHMAYDAWGAPQSETRLDANFAGLDNLNNFTGYTYDEVLALYFAQNRFYSPETHRFTQQDPIQDGENWYAYCENAPTIRTDAYGYSGSTRYIKGKDVRLRKNAGLSGRVIALLQENSSVEYLDIKYWMDGLQWAKVTYRGNVGWISDNYLLLKPLNASKAPDFNKSILDGVMLKLQSLEDMAKNYLNTSDGTAAALLTLQLIRRSKYSGGSWDTVSGYIDTKFIDYVKGKDRGLYDYFENLTCVIGIHSNIVSGTLDMKHFAATLNALLYDSKDAQSMVVGETVVNALAGWAGDLQTLLLYNIYPLYEKGASYDKMYSQVVSYLQETAESSYFPFNDLVGDVDAYNISLGISSSTSLTSAIENYYTSGYKKRYSTFTLGQSKETLRSIALSYTKLRWNGIRKWPLLNSLESIPDDVSKAVAYGYADTVWAFAQSE